MNKVVTYTIKPIGFVTNDFKDLENSSRLEMMEGISVIEVLDEYSEGLLNIEKEEFINITFYFHLQDGSYELSSDHTHFFDEPRGVFACRSPRRPNSLGTTIVRLLKREGKKLFVTGFDALDGTPIIDIKNGNTPLLETHKTYIPRYTTNPRVDIETLLGRKQYKALLLKTAQMHNHICPGLTYGVLATALAMQNYKEIFGDYQQVSATVLSNSCFIDGVQMISGTTLGNKKLQVDPQGKIGVRLSRNASDKAIQVTLQDNAKDILSEEFPEYFSLKQPHQDINSLSTKEKTKLRETKLAAAMKLVEYENLENLFRIEILEIKQNYHELN